MHWIVFKIVRIIVYEKVGNECDCIKSPAICKAFCLWSRTHHHVLFSCQHQQQELTDSSCSSQSGCFQLTLSIFQRVQCSCYRLHPCRYIDLPVQISFDCSISGVSQQQQVNSLLLLFSVVPWFLLTLTKACKGCLGHKLGSFIREAYFLITGPCFQCHCTTCQMAWLWLRWHNRFPYPAAWWKRGIPWK